LLEITGTGGLRSVRVYLKQVENAGEVSPSAQRGDVVFVTVGFIEARAGEVAGCVVYAKYEGEHEVGGERAFTESEIKTLLQTVSPNWESDRSLAHKPEKSIARHLADGLRSSDEIVWNALRSSLSKSAFPIRPFSAGGYWLCPAASSQPVLAERRGPWLMFVSQTCIDDVVSWKPPKETPVRDSLKGF
jgi:hypothetical protein